MLKSILVILLSLLAFAAFNLGMDWINIGRGIHPAIAFPIATTSILSALFAHKIWN